MMNNHFVAPSLFASRKALSASVMTSEILRVSPVEKTVPILMVICSGTSYLLLKAGQEFDIFTHTFRNDFCLGTIEFGK